MLLGVLAYPRQISKRCSANRWEGAFMAGGGFGIVFISFHPLRSQQQSQCHHCTNPHR